jgi:hypothetical protein
VTDQQIIDRALERLKHPGVVYGHTNSILVPVQPLAALIHQLTKGDDCSACHGVAVSVQHHTPDCALIKLCQAINGEAE